MQMHELPPSVIDTLGRTHFASQLKPNKQNMPTSVDASSFQLEESLHFPAGCQ